MWDKMLPLIMELWQVFAGGLLLFLVSFIFI